MVTFNVTDDYGPTRFIVSPTLGNGSYTSITAAIAAAVAVGGPQTIVVADGTYIENLTLSPNITICSVDTETNSSTASGGVTIQGQMTFSAAGQAQIVGITINDNGVGPTVRVTGASSALSLIGCRSFSNVGTFLSILSGQAFLNETTVVATGNAIALGGGLCNVYRSNLSGSTAIGTSAVCTLQVSYSILNGTAANAIAAFGSSIILSSYNYLTGIGAAPISGAVGTTVTSYKDIFQSSVATFAVVGVTNLTIASATGAGTVRTIDPAATITFAKDILGNIIQPVGAQLTILEGAGAKAGVATLVNGTVTVATSSVLATSRVELTRQDPLASTAIGSLSVGTITPGVSFVINSLNAVAVVEPNDQSIIYWRLIQSV